MGEVKPPPDTGKGPPVLPGRSVRSQQIGILTAYGGKGVRAGGHFALTPASTIWPPSNPNLETSQTTKGHPCQLDICPLFHGSVDRGRHPSHVAPAHPDAALGSCWANDYSELEHLTSHLPSHHGPLASSQIHTMYLHLRQAGSGLAHQHGVYKSKSTPGARVGSIMAVRPFTRTIISISWTAWGPTTRCPGTPSPAHPSLRLQPHPRM